MKNENFTPEQLKNEICRHLDDKKAADISILDVAHLTVLADYFVVVGGTSMTNVRALAEYVEAKLEASGTLPIRKEGVRDGRWVVYDYGSVIVHILLDDMRLFYCLEKLWSDGKNLEKYRPEAPVKDFKRKTAVKVSAKEKPSAVKKAAAKTVKEKPSAVKEAAAKPAAKAKPAVVKEAAAKTAKAKPAAIKETAVEASSTEKSAAVKKTAAKTVVQADLKAIKTVKKSVRPKSE
ncbi:MAG: ribosome silencing factor [Clostridiales bacterium]|jgi:ribosome-associated protein|nr:ribosome silencing factor [Clostridiales bacterium]